MTVKSELLLFPLALCPSSSWSLVGGVLARSLDPVCLPGKRKPLDEWTPYWFFPSQRRIVTISGSSMRLMVLLAQGSIMVEVTHRMFSMLFTLAGTPLISHCTEGMGIPWKGQLPCSVFPREQDEETSRAGAVGSEGQGSSRHLASLLSFLQDQPSP